MRGSYYYTWRKRTLKFCIANSFVKQTIKLYFKMDSVDNDVHAALTLIHTFLVKKLLLEKWCVLFHVNMQYCHNYSKYGKISRDLIPA